MKYIKIMTCLVLAGIFGGSFALNAQQETSAMDWLQEDSVVVNQFGGVPAWSVSSAVSTVKGSKLEKSFTQNVLNTLYGELPGLTVMTGSGEPGADSPTLNARGFNTLSTTDRSVLVIVDGFESTLDQLSVYEIESISLLKDAAAAALYGMRAANGVLLVTTKRGADMPLEVNFSAQAGVNTPFNRPEFLDAYNYATLYNEARVNDGLTPFYNDEALEAYRTGSDPYLYPNVNWYEEVLKNVSVQQNYDLNFRGGNQTVQYFALLNVSDNNGFFKGTDPYNRTSANSKLTKYNIRGNIDVNITKGLSAHLDLAANLVDQFGPAGGAWNVYNKLANITPNSFPVYNPNGTYGGNTTFSNPVGDLLETGLNSYNARNIQSNLKVKYAFDRALEGLELSIGFSFNNYFIGHSNKSQKYPYYAVAFDGTNYVYNQYSEKTSMSVDDSGSAQWRNMSYVASANYHRTFAKKHLVGADVELFSDVNYKQANSDLKDNQFPYRYIGLRGRMAYAYDQRYMADFTWSYSGANLYAPGKQYGFFPAGSLGWIVSNEGFLKDNDVLTFLKIRASYGLVGHASIVGNKRFAYTQDYKYSGGYHFGPNNTSVSGMMEDNVADLNRTWEKENRLNVGVDISLLDKLDLSVSYFQHKRSDILVPPTGKIPGVLGMSFAELNLGRATNQGVEVALGWQDKVGEDFEYYAKANVWYAKNTIDYQAEELRLYPNLVRTGHSIDQPFGLEAVGLFQDWDDIANSPEQTFSDVKPGDIKYKDVNGDNKIDDNDVTAIGKPGTPDLTGSLTLGLRWKGFDFEAMFYGVTGRSVYLSGNTYWAFMNQYSAPASALGRWTEDTKETAEYPRLSTQANPNNTKYSSFWMKDGSFLKLKYVEVGYTLPIHWTKVMPDGSIRFFLNGTNLFSMHKLHKYTNADPEGVAGFPQMRTFSAGLKLKF